MSDDPQTDTDAAVRFLEWKRPGGPWPITAITPDGHSTPTTWLENADDVRHFVAKESGRANLHYTVAELRRGVVRKPKKTDLTETDFLHADLDPPKTLPPGEIDAWIETEVARLSKLVSVPPPSLIACSGNGLHLLWRLDEALFIGGAEERFIDIEARNRWLGHELSGDGSTWNCDRLLKLYGSINLPDDKKRKAGRTARTTRIIDMNDRVHSLADFDVLDVKRTRTMGASPAGHRGDVRRMAHPDELTQWGIGEADRLRMLIVQGCDPDNFDGDRSNVVFDLCCNLHRRGVPADLIAGIISDESWPISAHVLDKGGRDILHYAWRQVDQAEAKVAADGGVRPRVVWSDVEMPRCLDEAEAALIQSGLPVYQMAGQLVQVITVPSASDDEDQVRRAAGSLVIAPLLKHRLAEHFLTTTHFVKVKRDKEGNPNEAPFAPPLLFAETYMARAGAWRLPVLTGIATTPTMRSDGSVVSADGYDPASGLIIDTQGVAFPPVVETPSKGEGRAALDVLIDVISEFPFVGDDEDGTPGGQQPSQSRSVALAMIITAVARPMFGAAPMFGLSAPTMASGKSLLADVPAMIVTGRRATKMTQGASEEEDEKRLFSVLITGDPLVVIDNIMRPIEGDAICTILTEETWRCRILGRSQNRDVGTRTLFIATGNNLEFRNDMASRAVLASIDPQLENPGERVFQKDLKAYVPKHRAELAVAALTVLRSYIAAGRPKITGMVASRFEDWAVVRGALAWLGEPDPWATNARVAVGDEARAEHQDLMLAIGSAFGFGSFLATTEIIDRSNGEDEIGGCLRNALTTALFNVSAPSLGRFLKKFSDRRVDGMWIKAQPNEKKGGRYAIMSNGMGKAHEPGVGGQQSEMKWDAQDREGRGAAQEQEAPY